VEIEAKYYSINKQLILGGHKAEMGSGNAEIICSVINLLIPVGYRSTQEMSVLLRSFLERNN
jgi:hypothetical protein